MAIRTKIINSFITIILSIVTIAWLTPIILVVINSFKGQFYISESAFSLPTAETFVKFENYITGNEAVGFVAAFWVSLKITVLSVLVIIVFTSMTAWFITRVNNQGTRAIFYIIVASMIVPFQMIMYPMSQIANRLHLDNSTGLIAIYLGFGAGLAVFMYSGFVKSIPLEIEESATIDGCNPIQLFFKIVFPVLKPISVTVAILNVMWIWNDYLLPYLLLVDERTIPCAVQFLNGSYSNRDMGALMALLVLAIIPIIIFYFSCQKYIVKGVVAGSVKG